MPDREKVINAIECCIDGCLCAECDYEGIEECWNKVLLTDALALLKEQDERLRKLQKDKDKLCLEVSEWKHKYYDRPLKEQEAVEPTLIREGRNKNYNDYVCPRCGYEVVYEQNYCSECGIPFLWEGR